MDLKAASLSEHADDNWNIRSSTTMTYISTVCRKTEEQFAGVRRGL
jgi:hypothetical protein